MLKLETKTNIAEQEAKALQERELNEFRASRQMALDNAIVTTTAGNQYNADERSIGRMASALLAISDKLPGYELAWSMADTATGIMTQTTKADLAEAHRLAVENMAEIWGR
jgi:hypothetical protein